MSLYEKILNDQDYLEIVNKIENIHFITDGKWDWEHGLAHYQRVAHYVKKILLQLHSDERTIDLGMTAALLHDIGLSKGDKVDHAIESSNLCIKFLEKIGITEEEKRVLQQAIKDHSKGNDIQSIIGLVLVLADKLDVTYHRTINSTIQDKMNKEIQKIKNVDIEITEDELIVSYQTDDNFDITILKDWVKAVTIPKKVADYLNKIFIFRINNEEVNYKSIFNLD